MPKWAVGEQLRGCQARDVTIPPAAPYPSRMRRFSAANSSPASAPLRSKFSQVLQEQDEAGRLLLLLEGESERAHQGKPSRRKARLDMARVLDGQPGGVLPRLIDELLGR